MKGPRPGSDGSTPAAARAAELAPAHDSQPGSPWWRAVNESLLRDTVEADLLFNGAPGQATTGGVGHWLTFLRRPTLRSWYRAHNASIVDGYLRHRDLITGEGPLERFFMDVALLRVLYAHCLLIQPRLALGRLAVLGGLLGDTRRRAAAEDLDEPRITELCTDEYPVYAWPYEQRYVWRTDRSPMAMALIRAIVGPLRR